MLQHMLPEQLLLLLLLLLTLCCSSSLVQSLSSDSNRRPEKGDLLIGREAMLESNSTCGQDEPETYCYDPTGSSACKVCDSRHELDSLANPNSHGISNIVAKIHNSNKTFDSWWQSRPGDEHVTIKLQLGVKFTFTHLIMVFRGYRPKAWWIERSSDYSRTFKPYGYFAQNCTEVFPGIRQGQQQSVGEIVCNDKYTSMDKSDRGMAVFDAIPQSLSESVLNLTSIDVRRQYEKQTTITDLKIHFVRLHSLTVKSKGQKASDRPYYGLYEMNVHGMCLCNGHAASCSPKNDMMPVTKSAVYSRCDCAHNTKGDHCELCLPGFNDRPWMPATAGSTNECRACNCNGHSDTCSFSTIRFKETAGESGGICTSCTHNTTGKNCESCVLGTYRNPDRQLSDPDICLPCQCSSAGSTDPVCEIYSDKASGTMAGQCACKPNVRGQRCDECKPGFWNLATHNPYGCQNCSCRLEGTTGNLGCDLLNGQCTCKRNVDGNFCHKCKPGFFNLSSAPDGCEPCRCDIGGSISPGCSTDTGKCLCKPGFTGRSCNIVIDGFYVPKFNIDITVVQVENNRSSRDVVPKELHKSLTGSGGVIVDSNQKSPKEFVLKNPKNRSIIADVALKLILLNCSDPVQVQVKIINKRNGECKQNFTNSVTLPVAMQPTSLPLFKIFNAACINSDGSVLKISPNSLQPGQEFVIDAIIINKNMSDFVQKLQHGSGGGRNTQQKFQINVTAEIVHPLIECNEYWAIEKQGDSIPAKCQHAIRNISAVNLSAALPCNCSREGSSNNVCEKLAGQCPCYPNIYGRRCDSCKPLHYGFNRLGSLGCLPCSCSENGSSNQQCDIVSGNCNCKTNRIGGKQCRNCKTGFYKFPECISCACNGLANDCNKESGVCIDCTGNSIGKQCESCRQGYYGDPKAGITCERCQCPDTTNQHASECELVSADKKQVRCKCSKGYIGDNCGQCDINFYGNPLTGYCTPCLCNGNIDKTVRSCNQNNGHCTRCLNNTEGFSCERCKPGFHGDAAVGKCSICSCNKYGTDRSSLLKNLTGTATDITAFECNRLSGQCKCLPNVEGIGCSQCKANHFNLTSGKGCSACDCDARGSNGLQCDLRTGQCHCKPGRDGRQCDKCLPGFYGNPALPDGCKPCNCNMTGSYNTTCDSNTGQCSCKSAITGRQCNKCARGTTGKLPNCSPCGECWYNWDQRILFLQNRTHQLQQNATNFTRTGGLNDDLADRVIAVNSTLAAVNRVLRETNLTAAQINNVTQRLEQLLNKSNNMQGDINSRRSEIRLKLDEIKMTGVAPMNSKIRKIQNQHWSQKRSIQSLQKLLNSSDDNELANNLEKLNNAESKFNSSILKLQELFQNLTQLSQRNQETNSTLTATIDKATSLQPMMQATSTNLTLRLDQIQSLLPMFNLQMCTGSNKSSSSSSSTICSAQCGGPASICGAGTCGAAESCFASVTATARNANQSLQQLANRIAAVGNHSDQASQQLNALSVRSESQQQRADDVIEKVQKMRNSHQKLMANASRLRDDINTFLSSSNISISDVDKLVKSINQTSMPVTVEQMQQLSAELQRQRANLNSTESNSDLANRSAATALIVKKMLQQANTALSTSAQLQNRLQKLKIYLQNATSSEKASDAALSNLDDRLKNLSATVKQLDNVIRNYENTTELTNESLTALQSKLNLAAAGKVKISRRIAQIQSEQNATQRMLDHLQNNLTSISVDASQGAVERERIEAERRTRVIRELEARARALGGRLSAGVGLASSLDSRISQLLETMENSQKEVDKLLEVLVQDKTKEGSAAYIQEKIRSQHCIRR